VKLAQIFIGIVLVAITPAFCASAQEPGQDNQLSNWTYRAGTDKVNGYKLGVDKDVEFRGQPTAYLQSSQAQQDVNKFYAAPFQEYSAKNYAGKRVRFSAYLKTDKVQGAAGLWFKAKSREDVVAFDNMEQRAVAGTTDWQQYSIVRDVPADADLINIGVWMTGGGKLSFANLDLSDVGKARMSGGKAWDPKKYWRFANELKKAPVNFDLSETAPDEQQLRNWSCHTSKSPGQCGIDRQAMYRNKPSAFIEQQANDPTDYVSSFQDISAANYAGKRVGLSGFLKTRGVTDWTALWIRIDSGKSVLALDNMQDRPIKGDTDWTEHMVVLDVPKNATRIRLGFMQAGSGKSWLNNAKLDIVDKFVQSR
jgi:hypothetical protein